MLLVVAATALPGVVVTILPTLVTFVIAVGINAPCPKRPAAI